MAFQDDIDANTARLAGLPAAAGNGSTPMVDLLHEVACFQGLDCAALSSIAQAAGQRFATHGMFFFHQNEVPALHILLEGRARLAQLTPDGRQYVLTFAVPGDDFGLSAALHGAASPISAQAIGDCRALVWDGAAMRRLIERDARLAATFLRILAEQARDYEHRLCELATETVDQRIARALLRLVRRTGCPVPGGMLIMLPLSRQDLADMVGATLYTVSRTLKRWDTRGLIAAGRERVVICDLDGLARIADGLSTTR